MSVVREGHRPLLSPAQAAALARNFFGVHCDTETCKELPSYDDRNFLIKSCASHGTDQEACCGDGTASAEPMRWVLKVHNTRDTQRHAYFQAIDTAMLRLAAAGVLTNAPVPPTAADATHGSAASAALGAGTDAGGQPRAVAEAAAGAGAPPVCGQQHSATAAEVQRPPSERTPAGHGGSAEDKEGPHPHGEGGASGAHVPTCGVDTWPAASIARDGGNSSQAVASVVTGPWTQEEGHQEGAAFRLAWALLPCSCHPQPLTHTDAGQVAGSSAGATGPSWAQDSSKELSGRSQQNGQHKGPGQQEEEQQGAGCPQGDQQPVLHRAVVRCLTFVPGRTLSTVAVVTPAVLWSLGATMGAVTAALAGWRPPGLGGGWEDQEQARDQGQGGVPGSSPGDGSAPSGNPAGGSGCAAIGAAVGAGGGEGDGDLSDWHVDRAAAVVQRLVPSIGAFSVEQRCQLLAVAAELRAAAPRLAALPRQVCHADANDDNVLVSDDGRCVTGVIDFGDMAVMPRVCELSITLLYAMLLLLQRPPLGAAPPPPPLETQQQREQPQGQEQPQQRQLGELEGYEEGGHLVADDMAVLVHLLGQLQHIVAGYQSRVPLTGAELSLLPLLLRSRLAQSLTLGAASVAADPGNAEYLLATQRPGWVAMRLLQPGRLMVDEEVVQRLVGGL